MAILPPEAMPEQPEPAKETRSGVTSPREHAIRRLRREGIPGKFLDSILENYDETERKKIVSLNVLGFLVKAGDYDANFSPRAVSESLKFLEANNASFTHQQERFGVDSNTIASLLWVESRHGKVRGSHSVPGVYFSLAQADHPDLIAAVLKDLAKKVPKVTQTLRNRVRTTAKRKASWAVEELRALSKMHREDADLVRGLKGSYAGAFGYAQFIPSSYLRLAKPASGTGLADLFRPEDAIHSVAHYLQQHGWKAENPASWHKALFQYNRAEGYVNVILRIANCMKKSSPSAARVLAQAEPMDPKTACPLP